MTNKKNIKIIFGRTCPVEIDGRALQTLTRTTELVVNQSDR